MHLDRAVYVLGVFGVFLVSAACRGKQPNNELETPATSQQQTIALQATERLRDQWNQGACQALYDQATAGFRSQQQLPDWLVYCDYLRKKLGVWESFVSQDAFASSGRAAVVYLEGKARFGNERYDAIIAWVIENRQPRFGYLSLGQNEKEVERIPPPKLPLLDPPPQPGPARRG